MEQLFTILLQLSFVALVYYAAYWHGFKVSQKKIAAIVHEFSEPVTELIDKINKEIDQTVAAKEMNNN
jgi:hypothetical protein